MRMILIAALAISLAGCSTARQAAGLYSRTAEKGIEISVGDPLSRPDPAALGPDGKPLAGGLVGDTTNRAYAPVPPT